jgi:hypothetical protein
MSNVRTVPQSEWRGFFDRVSHALLGKWAEIEVASLDIGDQVIAEWIPLLGMTYDSRNDLLDVALDRASHLIRHPREIVVDETAAGLANVAIIDEDGTRHVVRLREALKLQPPDSRSTAARRR